jgi:hypothetical protein
LEKRHPERQKAREILNLAVKMGEVQRGKECEKCGGRKKVQAHHPNYNISFP